MYGNVFIYLFIYLFISRIYDAKQQSTHYNIWILKDECVATYIAAIKQKMHLINTMSVHAYNRQLLASTTASIIYQNNE